ncbi:MAG TPA: metallophosphoesterase [Polyangia bacterium]|nr:metallophosphoesterase [Polyangia bacterium]
MNMRAGLILIALGGASALAGCNVGGADATNGGPTSDVGSLAVALQLASGATVNTFSYTLTGPTSKTGSIPVSTSTTVSALISPLAAGSGYAISLSGTSTDGSTTCTGTSASFAVVAKQTTQVSVNIACKAPSTTGSVLVNGTINVCPTIDSISANPPVGTAIALASAAHDADAGPSALTYKWTAASGSFVDATAQNPTFNCAVPGLVNVTLSVSDGDTACGDTYNTVLSCPSDADLGDSAWVELGANNQAIARLITPYTACPSITIDGTTSPMNLRVGPGTMAIRPSSSDPTITASTVNTKASVFPVSTCEFNIPSGALAATVAGKKLPLPKANVQRVVVVGDTGCRLSIGNPWQACNDPAQWPFGTISSVAAAMKPDLVLHVGDYQYRDNACPTDGTQPQCQGMSWGYGYDTWKDDLFTPAAPLLAAAPWIMVRGNHETCNRAGQGWYRFLDINPYSATKNCNDPANDDLGNYNDPWAVTFGDTQVIAFDSANTSKSAYAPATKPADVTPFNNYTTELGEAQVFSQNASFLSIFAVHHPILGYTPGSPLTGGNPGMLSVMNAKYPSAYYPPGVGLAMHGHVHDFQGISFASGHPATFVAGHGGDNLDAALPSSITIPPAANTVVDKIAYSASFGFMVMDKVGPQNWTYTAYRVDGTVLTQCTQAATTACPMGMCSDPTPGKAITCSNVGSLM